MSGLLRLYPRSWRDRYGEEFEALLADRPPTMRHRADIVRGALDAHLHPELVDPSHVTDRWWLAPVAGLGLFSVGLAVMATGPVHYDEYGSYRDGSAAAVPFVLSVWLLLAGIARITMRVPNEARATRVVGSIAIASGMLFSLSPWAALISLTFLTATIGLAIGAARARVLPAWIPIALAIALLSPIVAFAITLVLPWYTLRQADVSPLLVIVPLGALWLIVALALLVGRAPGRRRDATLPAA